MPPGRTICASNALDRRRPAQCSNASQAIWWVPRDSGSREQLPPARRRSAFGRKRLPLRRQGVTLLREVLRSTPGGGWWRCPRVPERQQHGQGMPSHRCSAGWPRLLCIEPDHESVEFRQLLYHASTGRSGACCTDSSNPAIGGGGKSVQAELAHPRRLLLKRNAGHASGWVSASPLALQLVPENAHHFGGRIANVSLLAS